MCVRNGICGTVTVCGLLMAKASTCSGTTVLAGVQPAEMAPQASRSATVAIGSATTFITSVSRLLAYANHKASKMNTIVKSNKYTKLEKGTICLTRSIRRNTVLSVDFLHVEHLTTYILIKLLFSVFFLTEVQKLHPFCVTGFRCLSCCFMRSYINTSAFWRHCFSQ